MKERQEVCGPRDKSDGCERCVYVFVSPHEGSLWVPRAVQQLIEARLTMPHLIFPPPPPNVSGYCFLSPALLLKKNRLLLLPPLSPYSPRHIKLMSANSQSPLLSVGGFPCTHWIHLYPLDPPVYPLDPPVPTGSTCTHWIHLTAGSGGYRILPR
jgi:hypothetical protein